MKKNHWIVCPLCQRNLQIKIYEDTVLLNFPVYCNSCQKEMVVNVVKCRLQLTKPDYLKQARENE